MNERATLSFRGGPRNAFAPRGRFTKAGDASKRPLRRYWRRHGKFYARLRIGGKGTWVPIKAGTTAEATAALNELLTQRRQSALPVLGRKPTVQAYLVDTLPVGSATLTAEF